MDRGWNLKLSMTAMTCSKMLRLLRTKTATWMLWFVTIKSHCLLFIAPFGVNQVEDMIRVCKSRLLSLSCWMFKLLQISSNPTTSCLDIFLLSKARMVAFIVSIASSKSPAAYWAWPRAKSDLASGVACKNLDTLENHTMTDTWHSSSPQQRPLTWQVSRALWTAVFWPSAFFLASSGHPLSEQSQMDSALERKMMKPYKTQINQHRTLAFLKGVHTIALRLSFFFLFSRRRFIFCAILPCEKG